MPDAGKFLERRAAHALGGRIRCDEIRERAFEIHQFTSLDGSISNNGDANVKIDLTSVASGIDVRDVRMRFLLFETYKFPNAEVTAKLDMASLQALRTTTRTLHPRACVRPHPTRSRPIRVCSVPTTPRW